MNKATMSFYVRNNVDEIEFFAGDQLFGVIIDTRDTKSLGKLFCFRQRAVVNGDALDAGQLEPRRELIVRPESGAKNGETQRFHCKKELTFSRVMTNVPVL